MNNQSGSVCEMNVVYGISRWTNASRSAARHIDDGHGQPLCGGRGRKVFSWERDVDIPTCDACLRLRNPIKASLRLDGWAGRYDVPVEIVGETQERYRIRLLEDTKLPSRRYGKIGDIVLIPKYAVKISESSKS